MKNKPTALLSVYNKDGIAEFAQQLIDLGWTILASGGTKRALEKAGVPAQDVASIMGKGPILGHRVVTLSPEIHAALLASDSPEDTEELAKMRFPRIELVCVDLYPLEEEIQKAASTPESVTEKTDIGGPTLLRSAAKGNKIAICDVDDRSRVIDWMKAGQPDRETFIRDLAAKAEGVIAHYCLTSARYHSRGAIEGLVARHTRECCYGENKWQENAALFDTGSDDPLALSRFQLMEGSQPSYTNLCDIDRLLQTVTHIAAAFDVNRGRVPAIAVAVKHGNPCGAAIADTPIEALKKMIRGDTRAIFGGAVMTTFPIGIIEAGILRNYEMEQGKRRLLDMVIAPAFAPQAKGELGRKGGKCRLFFNRALETLDKESIDTTIRLRPVRGGMLRQQNYTFVLDLNDERLQRHKLGLPHEEDNMLLAWAVGSTSNSNTVTLTKDRMLIGNGVGQQDRVGACQLALHRAREMNHATGGASAYSDSFFPFIDGPKTLVTAGVNVILTSSGSIRDQEVQEFCRERDIVLYMIPDEVGRGFFGH